ncbi:unnamed protein product [Mytilus coruscus]|uniref:Uncharacterized protein n=1 Tax=Mytilus coruscus TaxID=42192 RepID=A0A6J8AV54_MYTCO|nr:unnamed protein product [Mytilus coruscus]
MSEYQIHVVSNEHFNGIIFQGPEAEKKIYLYFHDEHFDVITSMPAFLSRSYYCHTCKNGYQHKEEHRCNNICTSCHKLHEKTEEDWIYCSDCNRHFNVETLLREIERVLQSYEQFVLDDSLEIEMTHVELPVGGTRKQGKYVDLERFMKTKQCILTIRNRDDLCCARALVTAKANLDKHENGTVFAKVENFRNTWLRNYILWHMFLCINVELKK